jgi:glycosyltransferase involved in cell wall biosynthesis
MRILILTQYFPPEVGSTQNRLSELALRLSKKGAVVSILTAMPNYPQMRVHEDYRGSLYRYEELNGLVVHRAFIFAHNKKSLLLRLLNYFSFVVSSFFVGWFKLDKFDLIICESPPLFLGISGFFLKKLKRSRLVFNVSDLWPETAKELNLVTNRFLLQASTLLEEFLYRKSDLITGQTQGIVQNISARFPSKMVHWLPNGVSLDSCDSSSEPEAGNRESNVRQDWRTTLGFSMDDFIVLYAGIIGYAQGLEVVLKAAKRLVDSERIKFLLIGDGPVKEQLTALQHELGLRNVYFHGAVPRASVREITVAADIVLIPLRRIRLFRGAIPSKIFENLALRKPILLGVEGEAKELFIDQGHAGLAFIPEDDADLAEKVRQLYHNPEALAELGDNGYRYVNEFFNWSKTANDFWRLCEKLVS